MPVQFHLLCKLTGKKPEDILHEFMCNVGMEGYGLGEVQRAAAMEYFVSCGYGQDYYTEEDIRKILKEMESISTLFPTNGKMNLIDLHSKWRNIGFANGFLKYGETLILGKVGFCARTPARVDCVFLLKPNLPVMKKRYKSCWTKKYLIRQ